MKKLVLGAALAGLAGCMSLSTAHVDDAGAAGWTDLFDGESLDGWRSVGGNATYNVVDGAIVGTAVPTGPNTFLISNETYGDFILELELRIDGSLNSGVIFRGAQDPGRDDRVMGYQAEADPTERRFSGGVYEEALRGWLYPVTRNEACRAAFKPDKWNAFRVEAIDNDIRTFLNGVPCARLIDSGGRREGFLGLQVHSLERDYNGSPGDTASFRNIRIKTEGLEAAGLGMPDSVAEISYLKNELTEFEKEQGWKLLFNGETSEGWVSARAPLFPERGWTIEDGHLTVLRSDGGESTNGGDIITTEEFSEFELIVDFNITEGANSGIKYFVDPDLLQGEGSAIGLEFQILDDERHPDAKLGVAGNRTVGSLYDLIAAYNFAEPNRTRKRVNPPGEWNRARIVVKDDRVEHWLNDFKVVKYMRGSQMYRALVAYSKYAQWENFGEWESGPILLQDHGDQVMFRNVKIRDLSDQ
jgi:hypothetical protein